MEFAVTLELRTPRPITEGEVIDLAELVGAAVGAVGEQTASATMTVNVVDAATAGDIAARQARMVLSGATVEGLEVITTAEQDRRLSQ